VREALEAMASVDVLLTATTAVTPPALDEITLVSALSARGITGAFNTIGGPALALCSGFTMDGLPVSLTLAGKPFDECTVLRVGDAFQRATGWHRRHPPLERAGAAPGSPIGVPWSKMPGEPSDQTDHKTELAWAGLELSPRQFEQYCEAWPHTKALADRVPRSRSIWDGPANRFTADEGPASAQGARTERAR